MAHGLLLGTPLPGCLPLRVKMVLRAQAYSGLRVDGVLHQLEQVLGGGHARVSVPMSAGWSDAEVRVLIPEPSRGLGDGVGGWTFRGRPGPRRGVVGDCTEASERVLLSLDGALIRCRLSCRDYLLPRFSRNNDKFTERLPLPLSAVAASTPGLGCDRSRSASLLLSRVDTTARDIAAFAPRSGQPHTSLCSD